jgi:pimeloyl-ACP methyl ester carboxylesterase
MARMVLPHDELGTGPAVVLLHAGVADRKMWTELLQPLADAGLRAVAMDLPGFGEAPAALVEQAPWADVLATMDALGIEGACLVGNSFGGAVALSVAAVAPARVAALVLVSAPAPGLEPSAELQAAWEAEEAALERDDVEAAVDVVLEAWTLPGGPPEVRDRVAATQRQAFARQAAASAVPDAPDPAEERPEALATLTAPALVATGEHEMQDFHVAAQALARTLPHARQILVEGAGHLAPLEQPEAFRTLLLAFLRS